MINELETRKGMEENFYLWRPVPRSKQGKAAFLLLNPLQNESINKMSLKMANSQKIFQLTQQSTFQRKYGNVEQLPVDVVWGYTTAILVVRISFSFPVPV